MCCRLRLDLRELRKKGGGFFGSGESTGSIGVVTINLPRIAYLAEDEAAFFQRLDRMTDLAARSLDTKRTVITKADERGTVSVHKEIPGTFDNLFFHHRPDRDERGGAQREMDPADLMQEKTRQFAKKVLNHMRQRLVKYQEQYGVLFNLLRRRPPNPPPTGWPSTM
jgi:ribonucleoside-triphosphate reductase